MKIKLGVLFGGNSVEHEVSIITALQAIENMDEEKYEIIPIYITKQSELYTSGELKDIRNFKDLDSLLEKSTKVVLGRNNGKVSLYRVEKKMFEKEVVTDIDIAFPIVHGTNVEDGTLQGFLKMMQIPVVGSGVLGSALGMDKYVAKVVLEKDGIPVVEGMKFDVSEYEKDEDEMLNKIIDKLSLPLIIKPINLGSSVGIGVAKTREDLKTKIDEALEFSDRILVEKLIKNLKEVNCSVLGDYEKQETSECEELTKTEDILSYKDKYISGGKSKLGGKAKTGAKTQESMNAGVLKIPADITKEQKKQIEEMAVKTFKALNCSGVIRIDFIIDKDTDKIYVNEVNTIPGSLSFHLWRAKGKDYKTLLDDMINLALKRNREEENLHFSFDTNILAGYVEHGISGGAKGGKTTANS